MKTILKIGRYLLIPASITLLLTIIYLNWTRRNRDAFSTYKSSSLILQPPSKSAVAAGNVFFEIVENMSIDELFEIVNNPVFAPTTRNDAANMLMHLKPLQTGQALMHMLAADDEPAVWRNYCAQLLCEVYRLEPDERIPAALEEQYQSPLPEVSSCSLWSNAQILFQQKRRHLQERYHNPLAASIMLFLQDERHIVDRMSAIQSAALIGFRKALPSIRAIARNMENEPALRTVAIAALSKMKDTEAKDLLQELSKVKLKLVADAARSALKELEQAVADTGQMQSTSEVETEEFKF